MGRDETCIAHPKVQVYIKVAAWGAAASVAMLCLILTLLFAIQGNMGAQRVLNEHFTSAIGENKDNIHENARRVSILERRLDTSEK